MLKQNKYKLPKLKYLDFRTKTIGEAHENGLTFTKIAVRWGITRQRVQQIYKDYLNITERMRVVQRIKEISKERDKSI